MERKDYDAENLWEFDEDEARNRRRDPLRERVIGDDAALEVGGDFESARWNNVDQTAGASRIFGGRRTKDYEELQKKTDFEKELES